MTVITQKHNTGRNILSSLRSPMKGQFLVFQKSDVFKGSRKITPGKLLPRKCLMSSERLVVSLWNFGNVKKSFVRNILSPLNLNKTVVHKQQFSNTTYNLLTKFHTEKNQSLPAFQFPDKGWGYNLTWIYSLIN